MILLRRLLGDALRSRRQRQGRTLREVSAAARVSLGYLSEVERGQKEASSELLGAICAALDVPLSDLLREVGDSVAVAEALQHVTAEQFQTLTADSLVPAGGPAQGERPLLEPVPDGSRPPTEARLQVAHAAA
jgi:transcriptional regulator with XRE-family HTH domain